VVPKKMLFLGLFLKIFVEYFKEDAILFELTIPEKC
jgi:hypothetical protein